MELETYDFAVTVKRRSSVCFRFPVSMPRHNMAARALLAVALGLAGIGFSGAYLISAPAGISGVDVRQTTLEQSRMLHVLFSRRQY